MKREIHARLFVLLIMLILTGGVVPAYCQDPPSADAAQTAEQIYQEARALVEADQVSADLIQQALTKTHKALSLVPDSCKYTFAIGLLHYRLQDWDNAHDWLAKAAALPPEQCAQYDINLWLAMAREKQLATRPVIAMAGEVEVARHFDLKDPDAYRPVTEFSPSGPENVLPRVPVAEPDDDLRHFLTSRLGNVQFYRQGPFLLCGREKTTELEKHYQKGIVDAYRFMRKEYGFQEPDFVITVLLSTNPDELISLSEKIYPHERFPYYNPYFGFYAKNDHLLVATVGGGYGTLLHELMHEQIADDFPGAPLWLVEGLATLYERSGWTTRRLMGLPNWRMEIIRHKSPVELAEFERITGQKQIFREDLAFIRLLMLFVDDKEQVGRLYQEAKSQGKSFSVTNWLHEQGPAFSEQAWQEFVAHSLEVYLAEVERESGRLSFQQVMFIQKALNRIMQAGLEEDGLWGSNTRTKLQEFQERNGLTADGDYSGQVQKLLEQQYGASNL